MQMAIHLLEVDLLSVCGKFHLALDALTRYKIDITNKSLQSPKEKEHEYTPLRWCQPKRPWQATYIRFQQPTWIEVTSKIISFLLLYLKKASCTFRYITFCLEPFFFQNMEASLHFPNSTPVVKRLLVGKASEISPKPTFDIAWNTSCL